MSGDGQRASSGQDRAAPRAAKQLASDADLERFNAALKASEERARAERAQQEQRRGEARRREQEANASASALVEARRRLEQAVSAVRAANRTGTGKAEADLAWRRAKAEVIRLETGEAPAWAATDVDESRSAGEDDEAGTTESPGEQAGDEGGEA